MRNRLIIAWMFITAGTLLQAQVITVKGEFSRDTIQLGEQLNFTLTVDAESGVDVSVPVLSDTLSRSIEVLDILRQDTVLNMDRRIITGEYLVTSFRKGSNMVPPVPVAFRSGLLSDTMYSYPQFLFVDAPVIDTTQAIKPIKGPINTPVNFAEMLPWLLIGIGIILLVLGVIWLIRYIQGKRKNGQGLFTHPREPAHEIALRELDVLSSEKLWDRSAVKEFYTRLTGIIRRYMENAYQVPALERVSFEIIEEFTPFADGRADLIDLLRDLLELADLVKFAREDAGKKEMENHLAGAYDFVHRTHELQSDQEAAMEITEKEIITERSPGNAGTMKKERADDE